MTIQIPEWLIWTFIILTLVKWALNVYQWHLERETERLKGEIKKAWYVKERTGP